MFAIELSCTSYMGGLIEKSDSCFTVRNASTHAATDSMGERGYIHWSVIYIKYHHLPNIVFL